MLIINFSDFTHQFTGTFTVAHHLVEVESPPQGCLLRLAVPCSGRQTGSEEAVAVIDLCVLAPASSPCLATNPPGLPALLTQAGHISNPWKTAKQFNIISKA